VEKITGMWHRLKSQSLEPKLQRFGVMFIFEGLGGKELAEIDNGRTVEDSRSGKSFSGRCIQPLANENSGERGEVQTDRS